LGFSRKRDALSVLYRGLCDNKLSVVYEAADGIIGLNRKEIVGPLILLCASTSRIARMGASYALRNFKGKKVAQVLYGLLNDPCARVRIQVLETWKDHARYVDAVPKLIDMLFNEPSTEGRQNAIWTLGNDLKEARAYHPFLKLLTTEHNREVRREAISHLRYIPFVPKK
jgi:HEAT repeat protein